MPFFDFVFLRETGLNQYKKNANKIFDDKRVQKYFAKMKKKKKMWETFFGFFMTSCLSGSVVCCWVPVQFIFVEFACVKSLGGERVWLGWYEWRLLVCLFFSFFFPPIFRFASLNSPTMPFARVNRVERLYKFRCVCVSACVWIGILIRVVRLAEIPRRWNESTRNNFILLYSGPSCKSYSLLSILFFLSLNSLQDRRQQQKQTFGRVASFT